MPVLGAFSTGAPVMAQNYAPYGDVQDSYGGGTSNYGFAGEWTDGTGLQHLRARYLNTGIGRFISRDTWGGDYMRPMSLNRWNYGISNPITYVDPSGNRFCPAHDVSCTPDESANGVVITEEGPEPDVVSITGGNVQLGYCGWKITKLEEVLVPEEPNDNSTLNLGITEKIWRNFGILFKTYNKETAKWTKNELEAVWGGLNAIAIKLVQFTGLTSDPYAAFRAVFNTKNPIINRDPKCKFTGNYEGYWDSGAPAKDCILFEKVNNSCFAASGCWAYAGSHKRIVFYRGAIISDVLIVHEMGHKFGTAMGTYEQTGNANMPNKPFGFAVDEAGAAYGYSYYSHDNSASEQFADNFVGLVFNRFSNDEYGTQRKTFMENNMYE